MTEGTIGKQVKNLVELQKIDADIYNFRRELVEKPSCLNGIKEQFESKKASLNALEEQYKAKLVERNSLEGDMQTKEEAITKADGQLLQMKTNKEYTAKITEIENIKADKSIIEEKILMSYDETDSLKASMEKEKKILAEHEEKYLKEKKEIEGSIKEMEDRIKVLESQRSQIVPEIEKSYLSRYEKILINKEGLAIVPVQGSVCGGCFMNIPAQVINELKMSKDLIYCEICARIIYLEEDL